MKNMIMIAMGMTIFWQAVSVDMKLWQLIACAEMIYLLVKEMYQLEFQGGKRHGRK